MSGEGSVPASRAWLIQNRLMHVMCNALPTRAKRHTAGVSEVLVIWCWSHLKRPECKVDLRSRFIRLSQHIQTSSGHSFQEVGLWRSAA